MHAFSRKDNLETSNATIQVIEGDICSIKYKEGILLEIADFLQSQGVFEELSREKPLKALFEFPSYTTVSYDARMYAQNTPVNAIAAAIVFQSLAQRLLARSYYLFHKQAHPVKIFTNREKAIAWLNTL